MTHCPACGKRVDAIMEAHTVGIGRYGGNGQGVAAQTSPAGWCLAWPCGCTYSVALARLLAAVDV